MESRNLEGAWYTLDEYDNDPVRMFDHLLMSVENHTKSVIGEFSRFMRFIKSSGQNFSSVEIAAAFISEIENSGKEILLVCEDYHTVSDVSVHESVKFILSHLPLNLSIIITSRAALPFPVSRLCLAGALEELKAEDLSFTREEAEKMIAASTASPLDTETADSLIRSTGGWGMALGLACLALGRGKGAVLEHISETGSLLFAYLLEEVFLSLDDETQYYLLRLSVPDTISADLFDYLFKKVFVSEGMAPVSGKVFLAGLKERQLFISDFHGSEETYRFHDFFRSFLSLHFEKSAPLEKQEITGDIADWFEAGGYTEEALEYAFRSGDQGRILPLLDILVRSRSDDRLFFRHEKWIKALESVSPEAIPELELHKARLNLYRGRIQEVFRHLAAAESLADNLSGRKEKVLAGTGLMKAVIALYSGDYTGTVSLCDKVLDMVNCPKDRLYSMAVTYRAVGCLYSGQCTVEEAAEKLRSATEAGRTAGDQILSYAADFQRTLFMESAGKLHESLLIHNNRIKEIEETGIPLYGILGNSYSESAWLSLELRPEIDALSMADHGLELAEESCSATSIWWGHFSRAKVLCVSGNPRQAEYGFNRMFRFESENRILPWMLERSWALYLDYLITIGELEYTGKLFSENPPDTGKKISYLDDTLLLSFCRYLEASGRGSENRSLLENILNSSRFSGKKESILKAQLLMGTKVETNLPGYGWLIRTYRPESLKGAAAYPAEQIEEDFVYREALSERELEVLGLLSEGFSNLQISESLFISMNTVKTHLKNINGKLGAGNRTQAVYVARILNLC